MERIVVVSAGNDVSGNAGRSWMAPHAICRARSELACPRIRKQTQVGDSHCAPRAVQQPAAAAAARDPTPQLTSSTSQLE